MQGRRCVGNGNRILRIAIARHRAFKLRPGLPLRQPIRPQHLGDGVDVLRRNILTTIGDHWTAVRLNSLISATSRK